MQNYGGPIYLHIHKPNVCRKIPRSLLDNTKYSLDTRNISLIAAFLKKKLSLIMGKILSTGNVQVSPSVDKKLGKRWLYYNYWIVIFSSTLLSNTEKVDWNRKWILHLTLCVSIFDAADRHVSCDPVSDLKKFTTIQSVIWFFISGTSLRNLLSQYE